MAFGFFVICQYDIFQIDLTHNFWSKIGRFPYISNIEYSTKFGTHLINMLGLIIKTLFSKPANNTTTTCAVWVLVLSNIVNTAIKRMLHCVMCTFVAKISNRSTHTSLARLCAYVQTFLFLYRFVAFNFSHTFTS